MRRCYTGNSNSQPLPAFIFKPSQSAFGVSVQQQGVCLVGSAGEPPSSRRKSNMSTSWGIWGPLWRGSSGVGKIVVSEAWAGPGFWSQHCFWLNDLGHITLFPALIKDRDWTGGHGVSEWVGLGSVFCSGWGAWGCWGELEGRQDFRLPSLRKCRRGERCDDCLQANKIEHL